MHHIVFQVVPQESLKALSNKTEKKNSFIIKLLMAQMAHNLLASNDFYR